jgi:ferredoxin-NADP reductase
LYNFRITSVRQATPNTRRVRLEVGGSGFRYEPGQLAMIAPQGRTPSAPYSIASAPEETGATGEIEFLIKVDSHGRWGTHFETPARGGRLSLRGPFGSFTFPKHPRERSFLFIAGGTGIAPLRSMIRHAVCARVPGTLRLMYSARTPADFAYRAELRGMARRGEIELALTATREVPERWRGGAGRIAAAVLAPWVDNPDVRCFVCGPAAMAKDVPIMLRLMGIDASRIMVEKW